MVMPIFEDAEGETEGILIASKLMAIAARTAPKTKGADDIITAIVLEGEKNALADDMNKIADERNISGFKRDAQNVRDSVAVFLIGVWSNKTSGFDCGACGYNNCEEFKSARRRFGQDFDGPSCIFKILDLGIALGSAAKTASILNIDNRIMYRVGVAARRLKMLKGADVIIGIPISARGKSIYFDRK